MKPLNELNVKIFADGANINEIKKLYNNPLIQGFTTNPTLMRQSEVSDYEKFARELCSIITDRPISFEVFADDLDSMMLQGFKIASWGKNVNVKIPVMSTSGQFTGEVIKKLSNSRVSVNITAIMTLDQVKSVAECLHPDTSSIISVFCGRVADTGIDPIPLMKSSKRVLESMPHASLLWASSRELLNIYHAEESGADIITITPAILSKINSIGKDLTLLSRETVKMFYDDAKASGYSIKTDV